MKGRDIIFTSLQSWDIPIGSNAKNIAQQMSLDNRVLYVNPPLDIATRLRQKHTEKRSGLRKISSNLYVLDLPITILSINYIHDSWLFDRLNRLNNKSIAKQILYFASELGLREFIHINDNDIFRGFYLKDFLHPILSIYYRRDWLLDVDYWKRQGSRLEPTLVKKSDLVLANSPYLAETVKDYNPSSYYVGQGVDLSLYDPTKQYDLPPTMSGLKRPIIGYTGAINSLRLDADLLYNLARQMPECTFFMVGPEDDFFKSHVMHTLPNLIFIGTRPPEDLVNFIAHFDICINPQVLNATTLGNYPRKIDEYLAMGKPVVATDTPTMRIFLPNVALCVDANGYMTAILEFLKNDSESTRQSRIDIAQSHSWKSSVELMYHYIDRML